MTASPESTGAIAEDKEGMTNDETETERKSNLVPVTTPGKGNITEGLSKKSHGADDKME